MDSKKSLPPVKQLFIESWEVFKTSALSLFMLNIAGIVLYLCIGFIAIIGFFAVGAGIFAKGFTPESLGMLFTPGFLIPTIIFVVVGLIALLVMGSVLQISMVLLIDSKGKQSIQGAIRKSFSYIVPLVLSGVVMSLILFGSFFVFIFPAFLFSFLLMFVSYEIILNNKTVLDALRGSVTLISENFIELIVRWMAIIGMYIVLGVALPNLFMKVIRFSPELGFIGYGFSSIINVFFVWFMTVYSVTLYKQTREHSSKVEQKSMKWIYLVSVIGWIIAFLVFSAGWKLITSPAFLDAFRKNAKTNSASYSLPTTSLTQVPLPTVGSYQPATANCTQYIIREGEFTSDKCYSAKDYSDLLYYLQRYDSAASVYNGAIASMNITCNGSEFFKDACARDTTDKTNAENDINNYKGIITAIISRGK